MTSLGNWEEGGGDDPSQETCLNVEPQTCGPRVYVLTNVFQTIPRALGKTLVEKRPQSCGRFLQCFAPEHIL